MTMSGFGRVALGAALLAATLAVSGCYYGPAPYYGYPGAYPAYVYRPGPYYGGAYGYSYGYRPY